jgi:hypothetical protein
MLVNLVEDNDTLLSNLSQAQVSLFLKVGADHSSLCVCVCVCV